MSDFKDTEHNLYLALADVKRLKARAEELEQQNRALQSVVSPQTVRDWHIFTTEQIDAAWAIASKSPYAVAAFEKLNIKQCEGCGGEGKIQEWSDEMVECPDCNGHEWVKEEGDD